MLCVLCRSSCNRSELTYVYGQRLGEGGSREEQHGAGVGGSNALEEQEEEEVKGSYSTKIVALGIAVL